MSRATKYYAPSGLGLLGILAIAYPILASVPWEISSFQEQTQLQTQEEMARQRIQERKETSDLVRKTGLAPTTGKTLRIVDYVDDGTRPPKLKKEVLAQYLEGEVVFVYDATNVCIGRIKSKKFTWINDRKDICDNSPTLREGD